MEKIIELFISGSSIRRGGEGLGASGACGVPLLRLRFDKEWALCAKGLYFLDADGANPVSLSLGLDQREPGTEDCWLVALPAEPLAVPGEATLTLRGVDGAGRVRTTAAARFRVQPSSLPESAKSPKPLPVGEAERLQAEIDALGELFTVSVQAAETAAETAAASAARAAEARNGAETARGQAGGFSAEAGSAAASARRDAAAALTEAKRAKGEADRAAAITGGDFATRGELAGHTGNGTIHLTAAEKSAVGRALPGGAIDASLSNKAPAGFGLGNSASVDLNNATKAGFYYGSLNAPGNVWHCVFVSNNGVDSVVQIAVANVTGGGYLLGTTSIRSFGYNAWTPWDCINPPMLVGVEYRTAERYMGKPVYTKLVDCGALVDEKDIDISSLGIYAIISYVANHNGAATLPYGNAAAYLIVSKGAISMRGTDHWGGQVWVILKYTKAVDY